MQGKDKEQKLALQIIASYREYKTIALETAKNIFL